MKKQLTCDCEVIHAETVHRVGEKMPPKAELERLAALYKLFSDTMRVRLLCALGHDEMCVCDLAALLGMTKSAVSHQLKTLRLANLVRFRKAGQVVYYTLADEHVREILHMGAEHVAETRGA